MTLLELKEFLDEKAEFYQQKEFIQTDPIIIPHEYDNKLDIEISGFIISIFSNFWSNPFDAVISLILLLFDEK